MNLINAMNVLFILNSMFQDQEKRLPVNEAERNVANIVYNIIISSMNDHGIFEEVEESLYYDDTYEPYNDIPADDSHEDNIDEEDIVISENENQCSNKLESVSFDYKKQAVEYWLNGKNKLKFETVQNRFRKLKTARQLYRWNDQVTAGGSRIDKLKKIEEHCLQKFRIARSNRIPIHDIDIRRIAKEKASEINFDEFKASTHWLNEFKRRFNIVSRKITKIITKTSLYNSEERSAQKQEFRNKVRNAIIKYGARRVYNSDQSGFNYEIHSGRTLNPRGDKNVESIVQSVHSTTHSYTIQPTVSAEGELLSPFLLVLQESKGEFGPAVKQNLFKAENVYVMASKSGKLTKEHLETWAEDVYFPSTTITSTLLLDSWRGHCQDTIYKVKPKHKKLMLLQIPEGATGELQPLDVYGFRMWKNFVRTFSDMVILKNEDLNLHSRNNIIKMHSLVHNQLSSPRFKDSFEYAWYAAGYIDNRPGKVENPKRFCFNSNFVTCDICGKTAIITCSWCKKSLCLRHFFDEYHYCKTYNP